MFILLWKKTVGGLVESFFKQREVRDGGGYGRQQQYYKVMYGFEHMQSEGLSLDTITFICTLKACRSTETMQIGEKIHDIIMSMQLLEGDTILGTTLVDICQMWDASKSIESVERAS